MLRSSDSSLYSDLHGTSKKHSTDEGQLFDTNGWHAYGPSSMYRELQHITANFTKGIAASSNMIDGALVGFPFCFLVLHAHSKNGHRVNCYALVLMMPFCAMVQFRLS